MLFLDYLLKLGGEMNAAQRRIKWGAFRRENGAEVDKIVKWINAPDVYIAEAPEPINGITQIEGEGGEISMARDPDDYQVLAFGWPYPRTKKQLKDFLLRKGAPRAIFESGAIK